MAFRGAAVKLCWAMSDRERPSPDESAGQLSLDDLKTMLEAQLDQQLGPTYLGCWPLLVALLGIALAVGLLLLR